MKNALNCLHAVYLSARCVKADNGLRAGNFVLFYETGRGLGLAIILDSQGHYGYRTKFN